MSTTRRTKRLRSEDFENPDLEEPKNSTQSWPPDTVSRITKRVSEGLLNWSVTRLLRAKAWEGLQNEDSAEWQVDRFLGQGGFGSAALWIKKGNDGSLLDEVVVKERRDPRPQEWMMGSTFVSQEATLQHAANKLDCENIVHLRGFKAYLQNKDHNDIDQRQCKAWRYYLEYAPFGDLGALRARYRAFHRYLPELFLWHVFDSLARTVCVLEDENIPKLLDRSSGNLSNDVTTEFVLHLDIKPDNIFLGYEVPHKINDKTAGLQHSDYAPATPLYPTIKLGDFGCAQLTSVGTHTNPAPIGHWGTEAFKPPEQLRDEGKASDGTTIFAHYGSDWQDPPNGRDPPPLTAAANVWSVGRVIFDLCSLSRGWEYGEMETKDQEAYEDCEGAPIPDFDQAPFRNDRLYQHTPYSQLLTNLIARCMAVVPEDRPSAQELYRATTAALSQRRKQGRESSDKISVRNNRLYYHGNEINMMPIEATNCYHEIDAFDYFNLFRPGMNDPDDPYGSPRIFPGQVLASMDAHPKVRAFYVKTAKRDLSQERKRFKRRGRWRRWFLKQKQHIEFEDHAMVFKDQQPYEFDLTYGAASNRRASAISEPRTSQSRIQRGSKPQPPPLPFALYAQERQLLQEIHDSDSTDAADRLRIGWNNLPDREVDRLNARYDQSYRQYQQRLNEWEQLNNVQPLSNPSESPEIEQQ